MIKKSDFWFNYEKYAKHNFFKRKKRLKEDFCSKKYIYQHEETQDQQKRKYSKEIYV